MGVAFIDTTDIQALAGEKPGGTVALLEKLQTATGVISMLISIYIVANILFWFAYVAELTDKSGIYCLFAPLWDFVNIFYKFTPANESVETDFTGLVGVTVLIVLLVLVKSLSDVVGELLEVAKTREIKRKERIQKRKALTLTQPQAYSKPAKNPGFVFFMRTEVVQERGFLYDKVMTPEKIELLKNKFYHTILNDINKNNIIKKGLFKKNLFIYYSDTDYVDEFIKYVRNTLNTLVHEFTTPSLRIEINIAFDIITSEDELARKLELCDIITGISAKNEFVCTDMFREHYIRRFAPMYKLVSEGVYNLSRNLKITNNHEIFSIWERK